MGQVLAITKYLFPAPVRDQSVSSGDKTPGEGGLGKAVNTSRSGDVASWGLAFWFCQAWDTLGPVHACTCVSVCARECGRLAQCVLSTKDVWAVMMERRETDEEGTGRPYKKTQILSDGDEGTLGWS